MPDVNSCEGIPYIIPCEKVKAAVDALGITAKGVFRIEIDTHTVRVHRIAKDEHGRSLTHGSHAVRLLDEIPLALGGE